MDSIVFDGVRATVGSGVSNSRLIQATRALGLGGLQCLVGYPGTLGGALRMNAGGTPGYIAPRVEWVRGVDPRGNVVTRTLSECGFRYRGSDLGDLVLTEAGLKLEPADPEEYALECHAIVRRKRDTQPMDQPSAGCVWKNPPGAAAGRLVDLAGCKGLRSGDAEVSAVHANFIVNRGGAGCADVLSLMAAIRRRVMDRFGVDLQREVIHWDHEGGPGSGR
jgi:UDP-N-acetylmuramate dehydrogenase